MLLTKAQARNLAIAANCASFVDASSVFIRFGEAGNDVCFLFEEGNIVVGRYIDFEQQPEEERYTSVRDFAVCYGL